MGPYTGLLREVILRMKHWTGEELTEVIGTVWAKNIACKVYDVHPDLILPVPLHWMRRWQRGFNQSEVLAACLSRELAVPFSTRVLKRTRRTRQQKLQATSMDRQSNVEEAFLARASIDLTDKSVVLVDDVLTSGATASASAHALKWLRPRTIHVAVLAHGL